MNPVSYEHEYNYAKTVIWSRLCVCPICAKLLEIATKILEDS